MRLILFTTIIFAYSNTALGSEVLSDDLSEKCKLMAKHLISNSNKLPEYNPLAGNLAALSRELQDRFRPGGRSSAPDYNESYVQEVEKAKAKHEQMLRTYKAICK